MHVTTLSTVGKSSQAQAPHLSAELFTIPVEDEFLIYAPLRQAAFLANAEVINFIADLQESRVDPSTPDYEDLIEFMRRLEILDAGPERQPVTTFSGPPKPTLVSLFLTTACNLRSGSCCRQPARRSLPRCSRHVS